MSELTDAGLRCDRRIGAMCHPISSHLYCICLRFTCFPPFPSQCVSQSVSQCTSWFSLPDQVHGLATFVICTVSPQSNSGVFSFRSLSQKGLYVKFYSCSSGQECPLQIYYVQLTRLSQAIKYERASIHWSEWVLIGLVLFSTNPLSSVDDPRMIRKIQTPRMLPCSCVVHQAAL